MSHCAKILYFFLQNCGDVKMRFSKRNCIFCFCLFYVGDTETEKKKNEKNWRKQRPTKPYKNRVFKVVIQNVKNGFLAKIA